MSAAVTAPLTIRHARRRRIRISTATLVGVLLTAVTVLGAICAPLLTAADPMALSQDALLPPSLAHLMGTDDLGRDLFARVLYGGRVSLAVGVFSAVISLVFGVLVGVVAGFFGGVLDEVMMRVTEIFQILPKLLVAVVVVSLIGSSLTNEITVIGLLSWPATARVIRSRVQMLRGQDFIAAARMAGASRLRILWRSVLPNVAPFILVSASLQVASAIVSEAFLSFLGLGDPGAPSWGLLLQQGQLFLQQAWWLTTLPGLALAMTVLGMNLLGDGLGGRRRRR